MSALRHACWGLWLFLFFFGNEIQAQVITETFGTGPDPISIDFVSIGNPGNSSDPNGFAYWKGRNPGSVNYEYAIGKYEITRSDIEKANLQGNLGLTLYELRYETWGGGKKPATGISWNEAARFVNFLNTSKGFSPAYKFTETGPNVSISLWTPDDIGYNQLNPFRNQFSKYVLPDIDEWHKAAFFNPASAAYNTYANGENSLPSPITGGLSGVVYGQPNDFDHGPADVDYAGILSPFGTMAQTGNAFEWLETSYDLPNDDPHKTRMMRGGSWVDGGGWVLSNTGGAYLAPDAEYFQVGFRVASVPEPSSFFLALFAASMALLYSRSRKT